MPKSLSSRPRRSHAHASSHRLIGDAPLEDDEGEGEDEDDDVDHRDEDVPNNLEGRYSKFAQRRSRSGREGAGWWVAPPPPLPMMAAQ